MTEKFGERTSTHSFSAKAVQANSKGMTARTPTRPIFHQERSMADLQNRRNSHQNSTRAEGKLGAPGASYPICGAARESEESPSLVEPAGDSSLHSECS